MIRSRFAVIAAVGMIALACSGDQSTTAPPAPRPAVAAPTPTDIEKLINLIFPKGTVRKSAHGQYWKIFQAVQGLTPNPVLASGLTQAQAWTIGLVDYTLDQHKLGATVDGNGALPPTLEEAISQLIDALYLYSGMSAPVVPPPAIAGDGAVQVVDQSGATVVTGTGFAGADLPPNALTHPVLLVIRRLPDPVVPGTGPLPTTLAQYPPFYEFETYPNIGTFQLPVERAVCTLDSGPFAPPSSVHHRLQLAKADDNNPGQIIIMPPAGPAPYIDCTNVAMNAMPSSQVFGSVTRTWGEKARFALARAGQAAWGAVAPKAAYAVHGGLSGEELDMSPHAAVDPLSNATVIDFETQPNGAPTCAFCGVTNRWLDIGVAFKFLSTMTPTDSATLFLSTSYDPPTEPANHSVTAGSMGSPAAGFGSGTLQMIYTNPAKPTVTSFRLRGPASAGPFPLSVFDPAGNPLPITISRSHVQLYNTIANAPFREETITLTSPGGIGRVEIPMNGYIVLVDNVLFQP